MTTYNHTSCADRHEHLESSLVSEIRHINESLGRIERQVVTTNGRVSNLEKWKYGLFCAVATLAATKWPDLKTLLGLFQ